jgi:glyoxylase-like metal-dependent hydrolase (beta-lactamase superfamily II)
MRTDLPICLTCGVQFPAFRDDCPICLDDRQYVGWGGQEWTTLAELSANDHRGRIEEEGPGVIGVGTTPSVGIGQRALLVTGAEGNVLWDMITYIDEELVSQIRSRGGISAIAISHPHFYGTMMEWANAFNAPVYIHSADRQWVPFTDPKIVFWEGDTMEIGAGLTLIRAGVHFEGGQVLHRAGSGGDLFSGDILQVVPDRNWVSFMYSYPNLIPERPRTVRRALSLLEPFSFDRVYGAWWQRVVRIDGAAAVQRSAQRYLRFALDDESRPGS